MRALALAVLLALSACTGDETVSGYADRDATYRLTTLFGQPFDGRATIRFPEEGRIAGQAPCNTWSAAQAAPYPWFAPGPIAATKRACLDMAGERAFLDALAEMTLAEVSGPVLILSDETGREMVFRADQP